LSVFIDLRYVHYLNSSQSCSARSETNVYTQRTGRSILFLLKLILAWKTIRLDANAFSKFNSGDQEHFCFQEKRVSIGSYFLPDLLILPKFIQFVLVALYHIV